MLPENEWKNIAFVSEPCGNRTMAWPCCSPGSIREMDLRHSGSIRLKKSYLSSEFAFAVMNLSKTLSLCPVQPGMTEDTWKEDQGQLVLYEAPDAQDIEKNWSLKIR